MVIVFAADEKVGPTVEHQPHVYALLGLADEQAAQLVTHFVVLHDIELYVYEAFGARDVVEHRLEHGGEIGENAHAVTADNGGVVGVAHHGGQLVVFFLRKSVYNVVSQSVVSQGVEAGQFVVFDDSTAAVVFAQQQVEYCSDTGKECDEENPEE